MNQKLKHLILAIFSFLILIATLYVPQKAGSEQQKGQVLFGYPFSFVSQDFSQYDSVRYYQSFGFQKDVSIANFSVVKFLLSLAVIFLLLEITIFALESFDFKVRQWWVKGRKP